MTVALIYATPVSVPLGFRVWIVGPVVYLPNALPHSRVSCSVYACIKLNSINKHSSARRTG